MTPPPSDAILVDVLGDELASLHTTGMPGAWLERQGKRHCSAKPVDAYGAMSGGEVAAKSRNTTTFREVLSALNPAGQMPAILFIGVPVVRVVGGGLVFFLLR